MKHLNHMCSLTKVLVLFCSVHILSATAAEPIKIGYAQYRPYSFSEDGEVKGLEIDLLNEAFTKRMGIKVEHQILPWKRVQHSVATGTLDAFMAVVSRARSVYAIPSHEPLTFGQVSAFFNQEDQRFTGVTRLTLSQLQHLNLGVIAGSGWAAKNLAEHNTQEAFTVNALAGMLKGKRIDAVIENTLIFADTLHQLNLRQSIGDVAIDNTRFELILYIGKESKYASIIDEFDRIVREMKSDGVLQEITARYR